MRIVYLADDFPPQALGGAGISTFKMASAVKDAGHEVFVITTCRTTKDVREFEHEGLKVIRIQSNYNPRWRAYLSLYNPKTVKEVERILNDLKPDVVHANNIHTHLSYYSLKVAKKYAKAVVWTARDVMSFNYGKLKTPQYLERLDYKTTWIDHIKLARKRWNPFRNILIRKYLARVDKRFAVSYALKDALAANGIKDVEVLHTGADVKSWNVSPEDVQKYKEKFGVVDKKVILFGGRLSAAKGGDKAIESLVKIIEKVPNVVLLVAGKVDEYTERMQNEAEELGLGDRLIFTGWISEKEMKFAYACADVVLVPSVIFDSLPRLVVEAMAAGRPVVGTCYGGTSEIVVEGETGYVINPHNIELMAERVTDLLLDEQKNKQFGEAARKRVKADFDQHAKNIILIEEYKKLLSKHEH
ncbi:MAG TPA: glycosyltransferase family 4 protein [Candidatus Nanoarchaeia archaeon]|nr:glycosyltransferase family 4 protein [Candidatus Nanoarchaeia archaeon]